MSAQSQKCKAMAVFEAKQPFKEWNIDLKPLGPNDLQVKVTHCGLCHSDIHNVDGDWDTTKFPCVAGHEIVGFVTKVGSDVKKFKVGQRVGVGPQQNSCGTCKECSSNMECYCSKQILTYDTKLPSGYVTKGGFAEYHIANEKFTFPIPDELSSEHAAPLLCAGITVFTPLKTWGVGPGTRVAILGVGGLGHLAVQYAAALGAHVTALSSSNNKKDETLKFGAKEFIITSDVETLNKRKGTFDFILNTIPAHLDWEVFVNLLDINGVFCDVGAPGGGFKFSLSPFQLIFKRIKITGSLIGSPHEFGPMLEFSAKHRVLPLIEVAPLEKINELADKVRTNKIRYRGVVTIDPSYKPTLPK